MIRPDFPPAWQGRDAEGFIVIAYRLYKLDRQGRVSGPARIIQCNDDDAVLIEARNHVDGHAIEIWRDHRRVGLIAADDQAAGEDTLFRDQAARMGGDVPTGIS